jgi:hypothetical protein
MRLLLLALAMVSMTGCYEARTYPPGEVPPPPEVHRDGKGRPITEPERKIRPSPVYAADFDTVQDAVVRACKSCFKKVDVDDRTAHRVEVADTGASLGGTHLVVTLVRTDQGQTVVNAETRAGANLAISDNTAGDLDRFLAQLEVEMKALAKPAVAVVPPPVSATSEKPPATAVPPAAPATTAKPATTADRLRELDSLHEQKLITDEEYAAKRKAIVDGL